MQACLLAHGRAAWVLQQHPEACEALCSKLIPVLALAAEQAQLHACACHVLGHLLGLCGLLELRQVA